MAMKISDNEIEDLIQKLSAFHPANKDQLGYKGEASVLTTLLLASILQELRDIKR